MKNSSNILRNTERAKDADKDNKVVSKVFRKWVYLFSKYPKMFYFDIDDMISRKRLHTIIPCLIHLSMICGIRPTKSRVRIFKYFIRFVCHLIETQGRPGAVKYLKQSYLYLQQSISGYTLDLSMSPRVGLAGSNIPKIIPLQHRKLIRRNDMAIIRLWLTLFSVYRVISYAGPISFSSILDKRTEMPGYSELLQQMEEFLPMFYDYFNIPRIFQYEFDYLSDYKWGLVNKLIPAPEPFIIAKSSPTVESGDIEYVKTSVAPRSLINAAWAVKRHAWIPLTQYLKKVPTDLPGYINLIIGMTKRDDEPDRNFYIGKLGLKDEAAGKVRVFAMVDAFTQWVLRPLHDYIFKILRVIPMDGTFDQHRQLKALISFKYSKYFSYDLSSATDRLPVQLQTLILSLLLGKVRARAWQSLLVDREYAVKVGKGKLFAVKYAVGQPMGALSSWAMLALTHHFIVQFCNWLRGSRHIFKDYAVLGDDLVIANRFIARTYLKVMRVLDVKVNKSKSLVSSHALEFAKKFFYKGVDLSPISIKELNGLGQNVASLPAFLGKYKMPISFGLRLANARFRALSSFRDRPLRSFGPRFRSVLLEANKMNCRSPKRVPDFLTYRWFSAYSLNQSYVFDTPDLSRVARHIILLYCRLIHQTIHEKDKRVFNSLKYLFAAPYFTVQLSINMILDDSLKWHQIWEKVKRRADPAYHLSRLGRHGSTLDAVVDDLRQDLILVSSAPDFEGLFKRSDTDLNQKLLFNRELAIWAQHNAFISNFGRPLPNDKIPDELFLPYSPLDEPLDWWSIVVNIWIGVCCMIPMILGLGVSKEIPTRLVLFRDFSIDALDFKDDNLIPVDQTGDLPLWLFLIIGLTFVMVGWFTFHPSVLKPLILPQIDNLSESEINKMLWTDRIPYTTVQEITKSPEFMHGYFEPFLP